MANKKTWSKSQFETKFSFTEDGIKKISTLKHPEKYTRTLFKHELEEQEAMEIALGQRNTYSKDVKIISLNIPVEITKEDFIVNRAVKYNQIIHSDILRKMSDQIDKEEGVYEEVRALAKKYRGDYNE